MSEVSTVTNLILKLIGIAVLLGCVGTLGDRIFSLQQETKMAVVKNQISYGEWNRALIQGVTK